MKQQTDEEKAKILKGITEKTEAEKTEEKLTDENADKVAKEANALLAEAQDSLIDVPEGSDKENLKTRLRKLKMHASLRFEEKGGMWALKGLNKILAYALLIALIVLVKEMEFIGKASAKRK